MASGTKQSKVDSIASTLNEKGLDLETQQKYWLVAVLRLLRSGVVSMRGLRLLRSGVVCASGDILGLAGRGFEGGCC